MRTRWAIALVVALTVVLAGCAGTDIETDGAGDTGDLGTTTTGGDGDEGAGGSADGPPSDAGSGADGDVVGIGDPASLLTDAGSFTASWSYEFTEAGERTSRFEYDVAVAIATNRSFEFSRTFDGETTGDEFVFQQYNDGERSYVKYGAPRKPSS